MTSHNETTQIPFLGIRSVALVANGVIRDYSLIGRLIRAYERVVAVDGGLFYCQQMNIIPDLLIGDFDSVTPELLQQYSHIPKLQFPTDKDDTDLELALQVVNTPDVEAIGLFGVMGHRVDHALNNLSLACRFSKIVVETETESIFCIDCEKHIDCLQGQKLSLLPLNSPVIGVTTTGLKWELKNATFDKYFRSISNVCLGRSVQIHVDSGELICFLSRI